VYPARGGALRSGRAVLAGERAHPNARWNEHELRAAMTRNLALAIVRAWLKA
jgi:hypothetical protein